MDIKKRKLDFHNTIIELLHTARQKVVRSVNQTMTYTYYEIGKRIVEEEQKGEERADYGKQLLSSLSKTLGQEFGRGFSIRNLEQMRKFYLVYTIPQTLSAELKTTKRQYSKFNISWSHYTFLIRIEDSNERKFYEIESEKNNWSIRELKRQHNSALYNRLKLGRNTKEIKSLSKKGPPKDLIKDPYILEFIGLPEHSSYSENELESTIINKLELFLLELGNGFTFVARQKRFSFDDKHFYIDLVFYNRILNCMVLIDLKIGELKHQDIGQMQMYVNYYDRKLTLEHENKTIGLILSQHKNDAVVQYTLPENNDQIFASKHKTILPSKKELKKLLTTKTT